MSFMHKDKEQWRVRLLWAHVMRCAVYDYVVYKGVRAHKIDRLRAHQFLFGKEMGRSDMPTFCEICEEIGWEPDYIRRLIRSMTREDIKHLDFDGMYSDVLEQYKDEEELLLKEWASNIRPIQPVTKPRVVYRHPNDLPLSKIAVA